MLDSSLPLLFTMAAWIAARFTAAPVPVPSTTRLILSACWLMLLRTLLMSLLKLLRRLSAVTVSSLRTLATSFAKATRRLSAVTVISLRRLAASFSKLTRRLSAVSSISLRTLPMVSKATVSRSSSMSIRPVMVTRYPSARVTRPWIPYPSTLSAATRLQSTPSGPWPMMASATMATWSLVSTNQAWSSSIFFFAPRPPPLRLASLPAACWLKMLAMSSFSLASTTFILSWLLILSGHCSRVTFSRIVVPNSGSGTRHTRFSRSASSGSPVSRLRSSPLTVTVTMGSQWRFSRSSAQLRSSASLSMAWLVSILQQVP